ncbi:hypothetical protein [Bacillus marasmi]|uniref:hypothetical protein n=1 Tax=Bacillus marasmi TaxID=1926279 RepID=UPI0011C90E1B|nr:hypothetical protein [Bacillus marasmi]
MINKMTLQYKSVYTDLEFERADLFAAINQKYQIKTVLYPGCNIHVTPAFYFQHVVFVDIADNAIQFFSDQTDVQQFINSHKKYKQSSYIRFINQDYTTQLPLIDNEYDLLISLFAGGISKACGRYIINGGYLLTNNHHNDAHDAITSGQFKLIAIIHKKQKKYEISEANLEKHITQIEKNLQSKQQLCKNNPAGGIQYKQNETFYLFTKTKR